MIKDRLGRVIEDVQAVTLPVDGRDLRLSIDTRLQYLVYKELQAALDKHQARAATAVVLDVHTGEILALANLPSYDPNRRENWKVATLRNQAITDTFEPGSIMKPYGGPRAGSGPHHHVDHLRHRQRAFPIPGFDDQRRQPQRRAGCGRRAAPLQQYRHDHDFREAAGPRNVGSLTELGLGQAPQLGFPGAAPGRLRPWDRWRLIEKATMAYGYGLSVSLLQVARAYTVFARDGDMVS